MNGLNFLEGHNRRKKVKKIITNFVLFFFLFYSLGAVFVPNTIAVGYGSISGCKYNDINNNGVIDSGEGTLQGWAIILSSGPGGTQKGIVITDARGCYSFGNLPSGHYEVYEGPNIDKEPFVLTYPSNPYRIDLADVQGGSDLAHVVDVDFANYFPVCSNSILDSGEECDDGLDNGLVCAADYNSSCTYCSDVCEVVEVIGSYCGDGVVDTDYGEECDGTDGVGANQTCSNECILVDAPVCGDNTKNGSEECDGTDGVGEHQDCSETCTLIDLTYCGDGTKQTPNDEGTGGPSNDGNEECDGQDGVDTNQTCSDECILIDNPVCGDNTKNGSEECDGTDGVGEHQDCSETCTLIDLTYCGDGTKQTPNTEGAGGPAGDGNEECDGTDGVGANQTCSDECILVDVEEGCGDGIKSDSEACDYGLDNGVICEAVYGSSCTYCSDVCEIVEVSGAYCGDGAVDADYGEECDDGNTDDGDGCSSECHIPASPPSCTSGCGGGGGTRYYPRLILDKSVDKLFALQGEILNYTINISNVNNENGTDLVLRDDLPIGLSYIDYDSQSREWSLDAIKVGETKIITYQVKIDDDAPAGVYTNTAVAEVSNGYLPYSKATDDAEVQVKISSGGPVLALSKTSELDFANPGGEIFYNIVVKNIGEKTALNTVLVDSLPEGFSEMDSEQTEMTWNLGDLVPGQEENFSYRVFVDTSVDAGEYENIAIATADNHSDVSATHTVEIRAVEVLGIELLPDTSGNILSAKRLIHLFVIIITLLLLVLNNRKHKNEVLVDFLKPNLKV